MPRLIQRLANFLQRYSAGQIRKKPQKHRTNNPKRTRPDILKPVRKTSLVSRKRSILLDEVNSVIHPEEFSFSNALRRAQLDGKVDPSLSMEAENSAMTSPYIRMLSSPMRQCILTKLLLPKDFLIRIGAAKDEKTGIQYLFPNSVEHPKFSPQSHGPACWVSCWKDAMEVALQAGVYKRTIHGNVTVHSMFLQQTENLLRRRLFQEIVLLRDQLVLKSRSQPRSNSWILRKLTMDEWNEAEKSGMLDIPGAQAIIVLPSIPKQFRTEAHSSSRLEDPSPISTTVTDQSDRTHLRPVPVYNARALFPSSVERHDARVVLNEILNVERTLRKRFPADKQEVTEPSRASNAYLLRSTQDTTSRADIVPMCISLWRLRMWSGQGWSHGLWGGWEESGRG